jgi:toxin FitB
VIVVDTNVVSEIMRDAPDPHVAAWAAGVGLVHTTAVTLAEIEYGIARLPDGRRRNDLALVASRVFADLGDLVLPFDADAARQYAGIVAGRERAGRPIDVPDAQIAAVCASRGALLATRNIADFDGVGLDLLDPWSG